MATPHLEQVTMGSALASRPGDGLSRVELRRTARITSHTRTMRTTTRRRRATAARERKDARQFIAGLALER